MPMAMMSPHGLLEKQAMLEAPDLKKRTTGDPPLQ